MFTFTTCWRYTSGSGVTGTSGFVVLTVKFPRLRLCRILSSGAELKLAFIDVTGVPFVVIHPFTSSVILSQNSLLGVPSELNAPIDSGALPLAN